MKLQMSELENADWKKKYNKLKKEKLEEASQRQQQTAKQIACTNAQDSTLLKPKKKLNDECDESDILSFELGTQPTSDAVNLRPDKFIVNSDIIRPKGSLLGGPKMKLNNSFAATKIANPFNLGTNRTGNQLVLNFKA